MISEKHIAILENLIKIEEKTGKGLRGHQLVYAVQKWCDLKQNTSKDHVDDLHRAGYLDASGETVIVTENGKKYLNSIRR